MPLIEAMARNCRIACSDLEVFRELCADRAKYFDPNSPAGMWCTIESELHDKTPVNNSDFVQTFLWQRIANDLLRHLTTNKKQ